MNDMWQWNFHFVDVEMLSEVNIDLVSEVFYHNRKMINTRHFIEMLKERDISMEMVDSAMTVPDRVEDMEDGT